MYIYIYIYVYIYIYICIICLLVTESSRYFYKVAELQQKKF